METKKCAKCGPKPVTEFGRHKSNKDGLQSYCYTCKNASRKAGKKKSSQKPEFLKIGKVKFVEDYWSMMKRSGNKKIPPVFCWYGGIKLTESQLRARVK